ncbi:MAG: hypothetical protein Q9162_007737 [Coniocarpon cinnabarinum]
MFQARAVFYARKITAVRCLNLTAAVANNFWGKDDAGVTPLLERMQGAKTTSDELKSFYSARAALEEEYSRKLLSLARKPLGSAEGGTLRMSLDVVRAEVESVGKSHQNIAQQMRSELDEQLAAFAGGMKERRKIVQTGIEKLLKTKTQQTGTLNKARDKYEQDCLKIKGYLAQGHMVMGQEERKNKAKLEKTQLQLSATQSEYEQAVKIVEETTGRWNREWKAACDKFQDLEEERIDFMKNSLWSFANIASTVCVSDDASCEKVRLSLEDCEVEKDIATFIRECGTGQEIPDPPKFINFCRGDLNDSGSEISNDDAYSVAQFQRTINPTYRSSSPQPSNADSIQDPNSSLAHDMGIGSSHVSPQASQPNSADNTPRKPYYQQGPPQETSFRSYANSNHSHQAASQHGDFPEVPHNEYPVDGMTQFCRIGPPNGSDLSSNASPARPSSRDSQSEYSNPTSFSSQEPSLGAPSPTKGLDGSDLSHRSAPEAAKKKTGLFQNRSPFRRKSKSEKDRPQSIAAGPGNTSSWASNSAGTSRPGMSFGRGQLNNRASPSPEPADPRASFQLNVGNNVFDVASPDAKRHPPQKQTMDGQDEMAKALAAVKDLTKQSSVRASQDRYAASTNPAPNTSSNMNPSARGRQAQLPDRTAAAPSYTHQPQQPMSRLGAPQPAHTARQMQQTTQRFAEQNRNLFNSPSSQPHPGARAPARPTSPLPMRSTSPRPDTYNNHNMNRMSQPNLPRAASPNPHRANQGNLPRAASPNPYLNGGGNPNAGSRPRAQSSSPVKPRGDPYAGQRQAYGAMPQDQIPRARSPQPGYASPQLGDSMAMQLAGPPADQAYGQHYPPRGGAGGRPVSNYGGMPQQEMPQRGRGKSFGGGGPQQFSREGRPVIHFARAMYMYQAAIPEELSFAKGDVLAVLRHQDDGWWEAESPAESSFLKDREAAVKGGKRDWLGWRGLKSVQCFEQTLDSCMALVGGSMIANEWEPLVMTTWLAPLACHLFAQCVLAVAKE